MNAIPDDTSGLTVPEPATYETSRTPPDQPSDQPSEQPPEQPPGEQPGEQPPERLHPLTFVVGAIRELPALVVVGATGLLFGGRGPVFLFALAGLVAGLVFHALNWATFTYTMYEDRIELRRALIGRSVKTIPRERIRGVDISAPLRHRLLGLAVVRIDAGSEGGEGELNAVSRREAERLRSLLLDREPPAEAAPERAAETETVLARARPRWYLYAPLSGAYLLTPFAVLGSLGGAIYNLGEDLGLINQRRLIRLGDAVLDLPTVLGIATAALLLIAMPVGSVIAFTLFNWDFTLTARNGAIRAQRGLITRRSVSLERRRVRGVQLTDNPLERLAGVTRLGALVTGLDDAATRGRLLPTAPRSVAVTVAERVLGGVPEPLRPHPIAARGRRVTRAVVPPLALAAIALVTGSPWIATGCAALAVAAVPLGVDRYRQLGHTTDGSRLTVRAGSLRRRQVVVEHRAVVGWRLRQSLFQRRLGLVTLIVGVGAGEGGYPIIDMAESDATAFATEITPAWLTPFLEQPAPAEGDKPGTSAPEAR